MSRKTLNECKTGRDFNTYVGNDPRTVEIRPCGSHVMVKGPKPGTAVFPYHGNDQLQLGTLKNVIKMLIAIGLGILVLIAI